MPIFLAFVPNVFHIQLRVSLSLTTYMHFNLGAFFLVLGSQYHRWHMTKIVTLGYHKAICLYVVNARGIVSVENKRAKGNVLEIFVQWVQQPGANRMHNWLKKIISSTCLTGLSKVFIRVHNFTRVLDSTCMLKANLEVWKRKSVSSLFWLIHELFWLQHFFFTPVVTHRVHCNISECMYQVNKN